MSRAPVKDTSGEQHSATRTVVLHLLPGVLVTVFYAAAAPVVRGLGFPSLMAIFLAILLVLIPFELGYLVYRARRSGTTLGAVVLYREPVPRGQLLALVFGLFAWSGVCFAFLYPPLDAFFVEGLFSWLPDSFFLTEDFGRYPRAALLVTWAFGLVVNGFAGPVVEELYFRGWLLRRVPGGPAVRCGASTVLFAAYHLWQPAAFLTVVAFALPLTVLAQRRGNPVLSMAAHVLVNAVALVGLLVGGLQR